MDCNFPSFYRTDFRDLFQTFTSVKPTAEQVESFEEKVSNSEL